jgi:hypothetical protein
MIPFTATDSPTYFEASLSALGFPYTEIPPPESSAVLVQAFSELDAWEAGHLL